MRPALAFWNGQFDAFEYMCDKKLPKIFGCEALTKAAGVKVNGLREGFAFKKSVLDAWRNEYGFFALLTGGSIMMDEIASEAATKSAQSMTTLLKTVDEFRANIRNDLTSMKAASERVEGEVKRMSSAYKDAAQVLTSAQFVEAVANAEKLAAALEKISQLRGQRLDIKLMADAS